MSCRTQRHSLGLLVVLAVTGCGDDLTASGASDSDGGSSSSSTSTSSGASSTGDETGDASTGVEADPKCGNGLLEADEDCDDGNTASNDGCSKLCLDEFCGDGIQQTTEACDLGPDNADTATCTTACQPNVCGDGLQGPAETCDDGADGVNGLCALGVDGAVRCFGPWSFTLDGTLGIVGDEPGEMPPPAVDLGGVDVGSVVTSGNQRCVVTVGGDVLCWGGVPTTYGYGVPNDIIGDELGEMPPPPLELGGPALSVFGSKYANTLCAILEDHSVVCWGNRVAGLGSGYAFDRIGDEPSEVPPPTLRLYD